MSLYYEFVTSQATAVLKKMCQPLAVTTTTSSKLVTKQQQRFFASNASKRSQYDSKKIKEDFAYCVNLVKERDGEGYRKLTYSSGCRYYVILTKITNAIYSLVSLWSLVTRFVETKIFCIACIQRRSCIG